MNWCDATSSSAEQSCHLPHRVARCLRRGAIAARQVRRPAALRSRADPWQLRGVVQQPGCAAHEVLRIAHRLHLTRPLVVIVLVLQRIIGLANTLRQNAGMIGRTVAAAGLKLTGDAVADVLVRRVHNPLHVGITVQVFAAECVIGQALRSVDAALRTRRHAAVSVLHLCRKALQFGLVLVIGGLGVCKVLQDEGLGRFPGIIRLNGFLAHRSALSSKPSSRRANPETTRSQPARPSIVSRSKWPVAAATSCSSRSRQLQRFPAQPQMCSVPLLPDCVTMAAEMASPLNVNHSCARPTAHSVQTSALGASLMALANRGHAASNKSASPASAHHRRLTLAARRAHRSVARPSLYCRQCRLQPRHRALSQQRLPMPR